MTMRRGIVFATEALEPLAGLAQRAEQAGFARVWTTEYLGRDAIARALAIALATERVEVGTGIAYAFTRVPRAMAALASDVQQLSHGRFALGISSGTRGVRRWYGAEFDPPGPRLVAYADAVREAWRTDTELASPPPIFGAALNPVMTRLTARSCDGIVLHPLGRARTHLHERLLPALRRGESESERGVALELAAWCVTSIDEDPERALERARAQLAFYFSTPSYRTVVEGTEWEDVPARVRAAFDDSGRSAAWRELAPLIPDSLVDELAVWGSPSAVVERVAALERELAEVGVTELVLQTVGSDLTEAEVVDNCDQIIDALAPNAITRRTG